jgi:hypothetical protein
MLGVSSVTCGAMADDEGGRRAEQWLKVNEMIWCSELSPALPHPAAARRGAAVGVRWRWRRGQAIPADAAPGMRSTGFTVFTPITSRYTTVEISAIVGRITTKVAILGPKSGARNWASTSTR